MTSPQESTIYFLLLTKTISYFSAGIGLTFYGVQQTVLITVSSPLQEALPWTSLYASHLPSVT